MQEKKEITELEGTHGKLMTYQTDILNEIETYYRTPYRSQGVNDQEVGGIIGNEKITGTERKLLGNYISVEEVKKTIDQLNNNKSPGKDG